MISPTTIPAKKKSQTVDASLSLPGRLTCENRYHGFVDGLYPLLLEYIAREQRYDQEYNHNEQRP